MTIKEIIKRPEGRRLEFKEVLPEYADLAKTIVAFANDAGGELYIGVQNNPREIVGLPEEELMKIEEQVSSIIFDRCYPAVLPEITFLTDDDKHIIRVVIYRGSTPPYYLKNKGKLKGTYIRIGSTNRLADEEIISELERRKRNVSFDSELILDKPIDKLNIENFKQEYKDRTGEDIDTQALRKLDLIKKIDGIEYPTNALVLFSDDELRRTLFPFAKVECARFKGIASEEFIDQKSILSNITTQAEEAYNFILRHINKGATIEGVYTISHWEYPVKAIREVIRNAIVHRDYSLTGKDVKVAIYDDMIEETGLSFQVQFVKLDYIARQELGQELRQELGQELRQESENPTMYSGILQKVVQTPLSRKEISESFGHKQISGGLNRTLTKLIDDKLIEHTIKDNKNHPDQKIRISKRGILFLELLKK